MKNYSLWITNIIVFSLFIWFLKWNASPEEQVIVVKNVSNQVEKPVEEPIVEDQDPTEEEKEEDVSVTDLDPSTFMSIVKDLEPAYLKMENQRLILDNERLSKELAFEKEKVSILEQQIKSLGQKSLVENSEKIDKIEQDKQKLEQEILNTNQDLKQTKQEKEALWDLFNKEKEKMESDFLKKVESEVQNRIKSKEDQNKLVEKVMNFPMIPVEDKKPKLSWEEMWSKVTPTGPGQGLKESYPSDLHVEHKKILDQAYQEKIVDKVLWLHEQLSSSRRQLKSTLVKEVEMVKKEDDYSQTTDFLLSTGDRYVIISLSIPLEPAPYQENKDEVYWVTAKVFDLDSEVLRFQLKLKDNQPTTEEVISYIPGDWVKIIKSFK